MTHEELWQEFTSSFNIKETEYEAWAFGTDADLLSELVICGKKTATSSAYPLYEIEGEPLPSPNEYSVILNSKGEAVCIIRTLSVSLIPFKEITANHAMKEGEGDKSLAFWRETHESFFKDELALYKLEFTKDMLVVFEEFELVYKSYT
jgi:uncharacterized protein YhfF